MIKLTSLKVLEAELTSLETHKVSLQSKNEKHRNELRHLKNLRALIGIKYNMS